MTKIPCTVGILTLNCADSLPACLESLRDFAEIIVCDGNSIDGTQKVAEDFGARLIKQYDTDEPNLTCVMDKAAVREKNMEAAGYDWYFFMDADDTLSEGAVEEIREIVNSSQPEILAYRMPTRIFLVDKEIKHEATYPSYQLRLVHKEAKGRFKGKVHDHLIFDKNIKIGTLKNFYNFHWSAGRVKNFWPYLRLYADWEIQVMEIPSLSGIIYWGVYRRLRTILGYLFYRLPKMYLSYGFKNSMPLGIELTIVRYHLRILRRSFSKCVSHWKWFTILIETFRGKDINRILANLKLRDLELKGRILDIGSGKDASYYRFFRQEKWKKLTVVDINPLAKPDLVLDIEKDIWPFPDNYYNQVLAFNIFEHLSDPVKVIKEAARVLGPKGELLGSVPFLVNVHADPHDYWRFTGENLQKLLTGAGFKTCHISATGHGPFLAAYSQVEFLFPLAFKVVLIFVSLTFDSILGIIWPKINWTERFPLSYVFCSEIDKL